MSNDASSSKTGARKSQSAYRAFAVLLTAAGILVCGFWFLDYLDELSKPTEQEKALHAEMTRRLTPDELTSFVDSQPERLRECVRNHLIEAAAVAPLIVRNTVYLDRVCDREVTAREQVEALEATVSSD